MCFPFRASLKYSSNVTTLVYMTEADVITLSDVFILKFNGHSLDEYNLSLPVYRLTRRGADDAQTSPRTTVLQRGPSPLNNRNARPDNNTLRPLPPRADTAPADSHTNLHLIELHKSIWWFFGASTYLRSVLIQSALLTHDLKQASCCFFIFLLNKTHCFKFNIQETDRLIKSIEEFWQWFISNRELGTRLAFVASFASYRKWVDQTNFSP